MHILWQKIKGAQQLSITLYPWKWKLCLPQFWTLCLRRFMANFLVMATCSLPIGETAAAKGIIHNNPSLSYDLGLQAIISMCFVLVKENLCRTESNSAGAELQS
mmetsp:Transcript_4250/g.7774  ORF Transcript_4250/g.7774 Transcript_4250/m.7774 type:complete len:104 (+) Transcript_4250:125-436(+)